jgi:hypothetical protein
MSNDSVYETYYDYMSRRSREEDAKMSLENEKYVVVTCISQFRQRYVVPVSKLQVENKDFDITNDPVTQISWANDSVTMEEVKEFSQHWLGEQILDTFILDEERLLQLFDRDNEYLSEWTREKKIEWVQNCWEEDRHGKNKR